MAFSDLTVANLLKPSCTQVLLDDGREAWVKHDRVELIKSSSADKAAGAHESTPRAQKGSVSTLEADAQAQRAQESAAKRARQHREEDAGFLTKSTVPVHTKSLFRERQGGSKIAAGLL